MISSAKLKKSSGISRETRPLRLCVILVLMVSDANSLFTLSKMYPEKLKLVAAVSAGQPYNY